MVLSVRIVLALFAMFSLAEPARALEYCFLSPTDGTCTPAFPCAPEGCPPGFECAIAYYSYSECAPIGRVDCCHIPSGGVCQPGFGCVPHAGAYGVCLPWRSPSDFDACVALLDGRGGLDCAAHDCDRDGVEDSLDRCVCISDDQTDRDSDGIGDACDPAPEMPTDAGSPPVLDAGPPYDAGEDPRALLDVGAWADAGTDAGPAMAAEEGGCGCRTHGATTLPFALVIALCLGRAGPWARDDRRSKTRIR